MHNLRKQFSLFVDVVRLEQTVFALPFAYAGTLLAAHGFPGWWTLFWVTLAMFGARTAGMCANRLIDSGIDAANPRTADRALPAGRVRSQSLQLVLIFSLLLLVSSAKMLNPLCWMLSPVAVALLLLYSYTKRFTWACHLFLGLVQACAPIGGWLAVSGHFEATPLLLGLAIFLWIGGFDMLYACQDYDHDRSVGIRSIPARWGKEKAFSIARYCHLGTMLCLFSVAGLAGLGVKFIGGLLFITGVLIWQHRILRPDDLSRMQEAFQHANATISITLLTTLIWELLF
jgi:4-hydroxybenzoate polyprenyltransferase